jgi:hypothetical protein
MKTARAGWRWFTDDWEIPSHNPDVLPMAFQSADRDSLGWMYNVDFSSYSSTNRGVPTKGMTHFVRRRRILRTMIFDGKLISTTSGVLDIYCGFG